MNYLTVIGLEIHAELKTASKIFCSCENSFGGEKNTRVCPVCMGYPGTLPRLNKKVYKYAILSALALDCKVENYSAFDRKNYFYPDLPKAYQITQFEYPISTGGVLNIQGKKIRINRIHIEEDAGKLIHDENKNKTYIDFNRCGVPLIEIVTEPDFKSAEEVTEFVSEVALRLKFAGVCDAHFQEGSIRVDVNLSLMREGSDVLGTRTEIKNLNSLKSIRRAIESEIKRQTEILESGGKIERETLRFDEKLQKTVVLRKKASSDDYRYFPEPDILPVLITDAEIKEIKAELPMMPDEKIKLYKDSYGLTEYEAKLLVKDFSLSAFYDEVIAIFPRYKLCANVILGDLSRLFNKHSKGVSEFLINSANFSELLKMLDEKTITKNSVFDILEVMALTGESPKNIAKEKGYIIEDDIGKISDICDMILSENEENVRLYKGGNTKLFGYFMGEAVRKLGKGVNPKTVREILLEKLE